MINSGIKILNEASFLKYNGCFLFIRGTDENDFEINNEKISIADNLAGKGPVLTQATSSRQLFYNEKFNGKNVITADGTDRNLISSVTSEYQISGDISLIVVFNNVNFSRGNNYFLSCSGVGETEAVNSLYSLYVASDKTLKFLWESGAGINTIVSSTITCNDGPNFIAAIRNTSAKTVTFNINGSTETIGYTNNPTGGSSSPLLIASLFNNTNNFLEGQLLDIGGFKSILTLSDVEKIRTNSKTYWGY